jgi:hypothetical protein
LAQLLEHTSASAAASAQALHWNKLTLADLRETSAGSGCYVRPLAA